MRSLIFLFAALLVGLSTGQGKPPENPEVARAMREAAFLVGEWEGEGWMMIGGKREVSRASEKVVLKAGGTVLAIDGRGIDAAGKVVHEAFGIFYYDATTKSYRMRSFLSGGASGEHSATAKDGVIVWTRQAQRMIRYTVKLDGEGRWHEIGEVDMGDGKWFQFMEMKLKKVK